ncbi:non-canonical purine NTP diphosphatase [Salinimicrobium sp. HB62]|uniref:non-canonical purine NTP diphosphatase n=1 Tax=Salinimicrobium sp. HB62 TaxID=3077781 RepID=UPI002D7A0FB9|nr:non-canonical purine NTP diphosphatase [Salinimicrobium sp. HB62]
MKLVFATNNKNKIKEVQALMPEGVQLLSLEEIGCNEDIPETSPTIEGNAIQKAEYVKEKYGYDCFADDTGLEVEALDGAPGVYSARYAGEEKSSEANIEKLLKELQEKEDRSARFKTVIALYLNDELHTFTGICSGKIIFERKGLQGFGYDPVFQPEGKSATFAEMSLQEKSQISHRARATCKLIDFLATFEG